MSLISVVQDVCAFVGVSRPSSIFSGLNSSRTQQEMLALANEMAQRIAYDTREWTMLSFTGGFYATMGTLGAFNQTTFELPVDFRRFLLSSNVWRPTSAAYPMLFMEDFDQWRRRRYLNYADPRGEWSIAQNKMYIVPPLLPIWKNATAYAVAAQVYDGVDSSVWQALIKHTSAQSGTFAADRAAHPTFWTAAVATDTPTINFGYLSKNCIKLVGGGIGDHFTDDNDRFALDERLLKLGMIWQWKALKGSPYAEDMGTYSDALAVASGADKPAPTIIGRMPISAAANVAFPWPPGWGAQ